MSTQKQPDPDCSEEDQVVDAARALVRHLDETETERQRVLKDLKAAIHKLDWRKP